MKKLQKVNAMFNIASNWLSLNQAQWFWDLHNCISFYYAIGCFVTLYSDSKQHKLVWAIWFNDQQH
jgi:hypothetical protein